MQDPEGGPPTALAARPRWSNNAHTARAERVSGSDIPAALTSFVGRDAELAAIRRLLEVSRLLTLAGPGGVGKSRLALAVAASVQGRFADGVTLVDLSSLRDPALMVPTVARALGVRERGDGTGEDLVAFLRDKGLLLVLDNVEQIIGAAPDIAALLAACPCLVVIATSREPLRIGGEQEFWVRPFPVPEGAERQSPAELASYPAVALFLARARLVRADLDRSDETVRLAAEICARVDGLPLAIELAAARTRLFSPRALLERLERRLPLLTDGASDRPRRQQALRDTIGWSFDLLDADERVLFRRLAVFAGGAAIDAAEWLSAGGDRPSWEIVASLLQKSLAYMDERAEEPRVRMLETVREFAWEQLVAAGEDRAMRQRHATGFLALAEEAEPALLGPAQAAWLERLEREHDNFRAALRWAIEIGDAALALRLAGALWWFWNLSGRLCEGRRWLEAALALPEAGGQGLPWAKVRYALGTLAYLQGDSATARTALEEALAVMLEAGDAHAGFPACALGLVVEDAGDHARAQDLFARAWSAFDALGDRYGLAFTLFCLGRSALIEDPDSPGWVFYEESLAIFRELGDSWAIALLQSHLGEVTLRRGDLDAAGTLVEQSLALTRRLGDKWGAALALDGAGRAALARGEYRRARALFAESLALRVQVASRPVIPGSLLALARAASGLGEHERAARLLGAVSALIDADVVAWSQDRQDLDRTTGAARATLGRRAFDIAWAAGRAMTIDQAIAFALAGAEEPSAPAAPDSTDPAAPLSPREREVARLIARGFSNRRIAETLVITEGTAANHVAHILTKLSLTSRAQIAAWATERGLGASFADE